MSGTAMNTVIHLLHRPAAAGGSPTEDCKGNVRVGDPKDLDVMNKPEIGWNEGEERKRI